MLFHHKNARQNHDIKIDDRSFENVAQFKYLGPAIANQNFILEEIKWRLNSSNACYHSAHKVLSSRLLFKNVTLRIHKTIILAVILVCVKLHL
jgi:hypothetical protein